MILNGIVVSCMVVYGVVCPCTVLYGPVWPCTILYGHIWCFIVLFVLVRYCMVLESVLWSDFVLVIICPSIVLTQGPTLL